MATALECRDKWDEYIQSFRHKDPVIPPDIINLRRGLLQKAKQAAEEMRQKYSIKRILVVGSLAHQAWFSHDSDVDLAVEGLNPESFWEAWKLIEEMIETHPVDLIDMDAIPAHIKAEILHYGIEL